MLYNIMHPSWKLNKLVLDYSYWLVHYIMVETMNIPFHAPLKCSILYKAHTLLICCFHPLPDCFSSRWLHHIINSLHKKVKVNNVCV